MKIPIKLTIELDYEIYDGYENSGEDGIRFYLEENHCVENIIEFMYKNLKEGSCHTCSHAEVKVQKRALFDTDDE